MNKKLIIIIVLGLLVRLILMPISLHPDLWAVIFSGKLLAYDGVINIYDYLWGISLANNPLTVNYGANFFTYPPLAYYTFGLFGLILKPLTNPNFMNNLAVNLPSVLTDNRLYWHLFVAKLPYLIFDFGSLYFLRKLFSDNREKLIATFLWLFNPVVIYSTYLIGQFDIIPVFFTVVSLYFAKKDKAYFSVLMMGIGGAYKMYPLFFVPLIALALGKTTRSKILLGLLGLLPYFLTILPFMGSAAFRSVVLLSNQSQKILFAKISVSGAEYLSVFVVGYIATLAYSAFSKKNLWLLYTAIMLLLFSVTHYLPQWFIWLTPFMVITAVIHKNIRWLLGGLLLCWVFVTLMFEPSLSVGLFTPLTRLPYGGISLAEAMANYIDPYMSLSMVRSIFAGTSLYAVYQILSDKKG